MQEEFKFLNNKTFKAHENKNISVETKFMLKGML